MFMDKEQVVAQDLPSPEQMFHMAKVCISLAKDQDVLKTNPRKQNSHFFLPRSVEEYDSMHNSQLSMMVTRYTGRIARVGYRQWTMFLAEPSELLYPVEVEAEESYDTETIYVNDGYRATYAFGWTDKSVNRADKRIYTYDPLNKDSRIVEQIPAQDIPEPLSVEMLVTQKNFGVMGSDDCDELIQSLEDFSVKSRDTLPLPKTVSIDRLFYNEGIWSKLQSS